MAFVAASDGNSQASPAPSQGAGFMRPGNVSGNWTSAVEATAQRPFRARNNVQALGRLNRPSSTCLRGMLRSSRGQAAGWAFGIPDRRVVCVEE